MLYHFEFHGEMCWEPFGSGEGSGEAPIALAMADLTAVSGGHLPEGEYRYIAATSGTPRWEFVWLGPEGPVMAPAGDMTRATAEDPD